MLKALALLLLCGLLPICQGGAENLYSVAQVDKGVLENLISDVLAKDDLLQRHLQRLLTGGVSRNLLGGLTGGQDGGLLGGVLGGQNGGLLGGVLGGEGLLWLKFVDIDLPKISMKLFPGVGIGLNINTRMALKGNTLLGGPLSLQVYVNTTANARLVQDKTGTPKLLVENCKTNLGGIQILSGFLPLVTDKIATNLLKNLVPGVLCPVANLVLNILNTALATVNNVCPFGMLGNLHYTLAGLRMIKDKHIILNLNLSITNHEGKTTGFPTPQLHSLPLPPVVGQASQLLLPRSLLSSLLQLLASRGEFDADIPEQALRGSVPMTTSALKSALPQLVTDLLLMVGIRVRGVPAVSLQNGTATIVLDAALQVFARRNSSLTSLLTVDTNISLSGIFAVTPTKLSISLALQSISLRVLLCSVGSFDASWQSQVFEFLQKARSNGACLASGGKMFQRAGATAEKACLLDPARRNSLTDGVLSMPSLQDWENVLKNWMINFLHTEWLPWIKCALKIGIPLPNIFNLNFVDGAVNTLEEMLVINNTPKLL